MRHKSLRNTEAALLNEVCRDVNIEPDLIPVDDEQLRSSTISQDRAKLDISARGVYGQIEGRF